MNKTLGGNYCINWLSSVDCSLTADVVHSLLSTSNTLWDLGVVWMFFFLLTLLPNKELYKHCTIPVIFGDFLVFYLSMLLTASPGLERCLGITYIPVKN